MTKKSGFSIITQMLNWLHIKFGPKIRIFVGVMAETLNENSCPKMFKKWHFYVFFSENHKFDPEKTVFRLTCTINLSTLSAIKYKSIEALNFSLSQNLSLWAMTKDLLLLSHFCPSFAVKSDFQKKCFGYNFFVF